MAVRWNETKKKTVLRIGWEETKEGAAVWWPVSNGLGGYHFFGEVGTTPK